MNFDVIENKLEDLLLHLFKIGHISIYIEDNKFFVYVRIIKNGKMIEDEHRVFDVKEGGEAPVVMREFLVTFYDKVKYAYISTYIDSINLGFVKGCKEKTLNKLGLDKKSLVRLCVRDKWMLYTNIYEIEKVQEKYKSIYGVDYIFPLEALIEHIKPEDTAQNSVLYVINNKTSAALAIYKENELVYSANFLFSNEEDSLVTPDDDGESELDAENDELNESAEESLEDESLDNLDSMEDFEDIDDLDDFVVEEDDDEMEDLDEEVDEGVTNEQDLKKELLLFEFLDNALNDYYKNPDYDSDFITEAYIFDTCKCSIGLKKHIVEVFFIEPKVLTLDLGEALCNLSEAETDEAKDE